MIYVIGPSHLHETYTAVIATELYNQTLFPNCILNGMWGVPNWSRKLHATISQQIAENNTVVWLVSDYKLYNVQYNQLLKLPPTELLLDTPEVTNEIKKEYCTPTHNTFLGNHTLKILDDVVRKYPSIKLVFWCLYKRTKVNNNSSYARHLWYDEVKKRYKNNILDIDAFTTPQEFNKKIRDESAHPTKSGYILLDTMIRSITLQ
jgi:hypothetical protein